MRGSFQLTINMVSPEYPLSKHKPPKILDLLFGFRYFNYSKRKLDVRKKIKMEMQKAGIMEKDF